LFKVVFEKEIVMSKYRLIFALALALGVALSSASNARADFSDYEGAWIPTDGNTNFFSFILPNYTGVVDLYIHDFGTERDADNTSTNYKIFTVSSQIGPFAAANLQIKETEGNWAVYSGAVSVLDLGPTKEFGLYFWNQAGGGYAILPDVQEMSSMQQYLLRDGIDLNPTVLVTDAAPVPVPATAWLLGSGLIGLIILQRKRRS
jgi:hypothetical protein